MAMFRINQNQMATYCDVNRSSVKRAIDRGRLELVDGLIEIDADGEREEDIQIAALSLWIASASSRPHHQARLAQLMEQKADRQAMQDAIASVAGPEIAEAAEQTLTELNLRLKRADAKKRENEARTAEIQRLALEGEYLLREAVEVALRDHTAELRQQLDNLADQLAPEVQHLERLEEKHAAIAAAAEAIQRHMHASMMRSLELAKEST